MTDVHLQYRTFAANMRTITGLVGGDVGVAPDKDHLRTGYYHCGCKDIIALGRWDLDYSTRQARDRKDRTANWASAFDVGDDWPRGGRAAWLRWNNMLLNGLINRDPELVAIRAINVSRDGKERKRYDTNNRGQGLIDSTDGVYMHTHGEGWRDQIGQPALDRAFRRIEAMARAAVANLSLEEDVPLDNNDLNNVKNAVWNTPVDQPSEWDSGVPVSWEFTTDPEGADDLAAQAMLGSTYRRVYLALQGVEATYSKVLAIHDEIVGNYNPTEGGAPVSQEMLEAAFLNVLKSPAGQEAFLNVLKSPAGQEAIEAAVNKAEDS